ncbi:phosphoribosylamine--glycine ligase [Fusibacter paucivorans]|uniref:Phosphoribosylamine--glycine ligase n=1 Tax=Fusibacter paucivorans TaxID=76009 RepID=A0ABS5PUS7_9FIRM|nr:phosphoribosylamine--glycine ligase [Fusibacter paucivorans]MBS7527807.1 phosphoribosylamine--glycine ligase [Fusibacter paucivorans]
MKLLVIGSGGREHSLIWKFKQSPKVTEIFAAPGNAGIADLATCVAINVDDIDGLVAFAQSNAIDLTIVGPELPLVLGVVDAFEAAGLRIFGPNKSAARFEGSKDFTKAFLMRHGIPTAKYASFTEPNSAIKALPEFGYPVVVKADGLAAGKGVIIAQDESEAKKAIMDMMADKVFGEAGDLIVLESFLKGIEASILCFVDGKDIVPMQPAQDYKKIFDGDLGLNTGGMGTYSPSQIIDEALMSRIQREILNPFITGIQKDGISFKGILFVGIMIDEDEINVLEYNVRMGDPETEVTLPRLENDLVEIIEAILDERLCEIKLTWSASHAVCVIMASGGYPEHYEKGFPIRGLKAVDEAVVFHCGTKLMDGVVSTNGGRVLGVTALGDTLEAAREAAYKGVKQIQFDKAYYRTDIAKRIER